MESSLNSVSNSTSSGSHEISNLDKAINFSTQNVQEEIEQKIEKKKRGRKPKDQTIKSSLSSPQNNNLSPEMVKFNREQYAQGLKTVFAISGMYLAKATNFEGFNMTTEELAAISDQGSIVCEQFMPAIDAKYVALAGFALVSGGIYLGKVVAYKEHVATIKAKQTQGDVKKD